MFASGENHAFPRCACCNPPFFATNAGATPGTSTPTNIEALEGSRRAAGPKTDGPVIDCHGHYTTEPQELLDWRKRQIAAINDPGQRPSVDELTISSAPRSRTRNCACSATAGHR
jgi:4-oxalmesaconate hydratase